MIEMSKTEQPELTPELIAAAPAMLSKLKELLDILENGNVIEREFDAPGIRNVIFEATHNSC